MNNQLLSAQTQGFSMVAPVATGGARKLDSVQLLPPGANIGILYAIVDLGTHTNTHFQKPKPQRIIKFSWEFPLMKQLFNEGDTVARPTTVHKEFTYVMAEKSALKKFCDGATGRTLQEAEYKNGFDIGQFLNQMMIVNIQHNPSKKDTTKIYANYQSVQQLNEQQKSIYNIDWTLITRTNPVVGFVIDPQGTCFQSEQFTKFPEFIRAEMMKSEEGVAYASKGGVFAPKAEYKPEGQQAQQGQTQLTNQNPAMGSQTQMQHVQNPVAQQVASIAQAAPPVQQQAPVRKFEMIDTQFTFDQYKASGHTEETLVNQGLARYVEVAPVQVASPIQQMPSGPVQAAAPIQQAPPIQQQQFQQAPPVLQAGTEGTDDLPF